MRVAILTNIPAPYRIPLWVKLQNKFDITVLYTSTNDPFKREWNIDFGEGYKYLVFTDPRKNESSEYRVKLKLFIHLFKAQYDVLIIGGYGNINNIVSCLISKILRKKTVLLWDGGFETKQNIIKTAFKKLFYRHLTDAFCVSGENAKNVLRKYTKREEKFFNVHFTCDVKFFNEQYEALKIKKGELKHKLEIDKFSKVIICVSRLDKRKGIQDLLVAIKKIEDNNICLMLVGTGPDEDYFKSIISKYEIDNVFFKGFIGISEITKYYITSDLLVLPTYYDTWGLAINEGMACGLPVISSSMAGASFDIIKEGKNGYITEPGNIDELIRAIKSIIYDEEKRLSFSQESLRIIKKWTFEESVRGFEGCFNFLACKDGDAPYK